MRKLLFKIHFIVLVAMAALPILILYSATAVANDNIPVQKELIVGTMIMPPFAMKNSYGEWEGLSIDLLEKVAKELKTDFKIREFPGILETKDALINNEIDLAPVANLAEKYEFVVDFSHPYYRSGLAIAVKIEGEGYRWSGILNYFSSIYFLKLLSFLLLLWMIAGALVWMFEGRHDGEMFGNKIVKGLGHGIWWAAVTMTTVGYGDKAPKTIGGRTIAILWMLVSVILISVFTATITTSLTVRELQGKVQGFHDLPKVRSGSLKNSAALEFLNENGIKTIPFDSIQSALQAVADNKITAFIFEEPILKHFIKTESFNQLYVLPETFNHHYVGMAVSENSPLLEKINRAILKISKNKEYNQ